MRVPHQERIVPAGLIEIRKSLQGGNLFHLLFLFLVVSLVFPQHGRASRLNLEEKSRWVRFTPSSGLPHGEITGLLETPDGTLWAATVSGLTWFDGFQWRRGNASQLWPSGQQIGIRGQLGDSILVFASGTYFLGGRNGFVPIMKKTDGGVHFLNGDSQPLKENPAYYKLWVTFNNMPLIPEYETQAGPLFHGRNGSDWMVLHEGLCRRVGDRWVPALTVPDQRFPISVAMVRENMHGNGVCIVQGPTDRVGLWEWSNEGAPIQTAFERQMPFLIGADIDEDNNVVAYARTGQIFVRQDGEWSIMPFFPEITDRISSVLFRRNGDLCLSGEDGVYIWRRSFSAWASLPLSPVELKNCVNELLMTRSGDLWIGSANGVEIRHPDGRVVDVTSIGSKRILNVTGLQEDDQGNVWISSGSSFDGTYRWNGKAWTYFAVTSYPGGMFIHKIRKDSQGRLWFLGLGHNIGTMDDDAAGAYCLSDRIFTRFGHEEGLLSGRVYAFAEGRDGALWFGTYRGISRLRNGKWTYWTQNGAMSLEHAFCLAADFGGRMWFGQMTSTGLGWIDEKDSVHMLTMSDGIPDNRVYDLKVDSAGVLWVATRGGLGSFQHGEWSIFDDKSGLPSNALWPVLPLGHEVLVGTIGKGVAILTKPPDRSWYPRVVIEQPIVDDQKIFVRWISYAYYGEVSPENSLTRYKLGNGEWSAWGTTHELSIAALAPGKYTIAVQGKGLFGQFDPTPVTAEFTVLPPLYLRPAIYLPASAALAALITLLVLYQMRRVRHRKEIARSEERYRLITELMSDYAYLDRVEEDGRLTILWMTDSFTRRTGYTVEEAGAPDFFSRFIHADDLERANTLIRGILQGIPVNEEWRVITKSGTVLWIHNYIAPVWDHAHQHVTHIYGIATDISERKEAERQILANQAQLRTLAAELSMTEERERRRMATFLHDSIGQTLALAKMKLSLVQSIVGRAGDGAADREVAEIRELVEHSIQDTRSLTFDLSPPVLHQLGFVASVEWLIGELKNRHPLHYVFEDDGTHKPMADEIGVFLFHAVRELLHNIVKHAKATTVRVSLRSAAGRIIVEIVDDGEGFSMETLASRMSYNGGFGLFNIRERTHHFGGTFSMESTPGTGTRVIIQMPFGSQISGGNGLQTVTNNAPQESTL